MTFVKGQSGNPDGKPKGTKSFSTDFDDVCKEIAKENKLTVSEVRKVLLKVAYKNAKEGNFSFYKDIIDRYYGESKKEIDLSITDNDIRKKAGKALGDILNPQ